jgi:hypothetical protein
VLVAVVAVLALAAVLEVIGPSDPGTDQTAQGAPPASLTAAQVERIARRVERIRHLRFTRPVEPLFVARAQAVRLAEQGSEQQYPASRRNADEEALKLLGLMRPSDSLARALAAIDREQILGFYDHRRKRLVVVRDPGASRPLLEITLAHELVHALEDQRFGLREGGDPNDDAAIAETTLAEGTATDVMLDYGKRYFSTGDALSVLGSAGRPETPLPAYVEDTLLFPYVQGLRFVQTFRGSSGSWRAVDNVLRFRRPATEEQVLHTLKYATDERAAPISLPDLGLVLGGGWRRLGKSSVGELDLREIFKIVGRSPDPGAAAGWGGGRFELWRSSAGPAGCRAPCVSRDVGLLGLAWDTERDRRAGERALGAAFRRGLGARAAGARGGVKLWSSRGGVIAIGRSGRRTAVVLAPDARTAARVLAAVRASGSKS